MNASNSLDKKNGNIFLSIIVKRLIAILLLVILIIMFFTNMLVVHEDELVMIKEFGKIVRIIEEPGLYFKLPFIQTTSALSKKIMHFESQTVKVFTKDRRNLVVTDYALWRIKNASAFIKNLQSINSAEMKIESAIYSAVRSYFNTLTFDEIINEKKAPVNPNEALTEMINKQLSSLGIEMLDVQIKKCELPSDEEEALFSKIKTEREKAAKQYIASAENEADMIKAEADKQAKILLAKAYAESEKLKGKADADATRVYLQSYNQDPEFYRFIRTLESYKKTLKGKTTIILPIDSPYAKYLLGK